MSLEKTTIDSKHLYPAFKQIYDFLVDYELIKYCIVFYGTLLGFIRNYDFLEGDDDIDFIVPKEFFNLFVNTLNSSGFKINIISKTKYFIQIFITIEDTQIPCDFYFFDINSETNNIYVIWENKLYPYTSIYPIRPSIFNDFILSFPNDPKETFKIEYGDSYTIPIPKIDGNKFILQNTNITNTLSNYLKDYNLKLIEVIAINDTHLANLTPFLPNITNHLSILPFKPILYIVKTYNTYKFTNDLTSFIFPNFIAKSPIINNITITDLTFDTLEYIAHLHTKTWIDNYQTIFKADFLNYNSLYTNRLDDWTNRIKNINNITKLVLLHDIPIGFFHIVPFSTHIFISDFHVLSEFKRNYVGVLMFYYIFNIYSFSHIDTFTLNVYKDLPAILFYKSLGFTIIDEETISCLEGSNNVSINMKVSKYTLKSNLDKIFKY